MLDQRDSWWEYDNVHYSYLIFVLIFLVLVQCFQHHLGILIKILLFIHSLLLIGKTFFNYYLMMLFFGIKAKNQNSKEQKEQDEQTVKFDQIKRNVYQRDLNRRINSSIEDYEDNKDDEDNIKSFKKVKQFYDKKFGSQKGQFMKQYQESKDANANFYQKLKKKNKVLYKTKIETKQEKVSKIDKNILLTHPFQNLYNYGEIQFKYSNLKSKQQEFTDNKYRKCLQKQDSRYPSFVHLNNLDRFRNRSGDLNASFKDKMLKQKLIVQIKPLQKQFIKYKISRNQAIQMIVLVRDYFQNKFKEYKLNQSNYFIKVKQIMKKITSRTYKTNNIEDVIFEAKQLIHKSFLNSKNKTYNRDIDQLQRSLQNICYCANKNLSAKQELIQFYKYETSRSIILNINVQITSASQLNDSNMLIPRSTYQIFYNKKEQQNHIYNVEQTFLLLILANKMNFPTTSLIRDINNLLDLRK